MLKGGSSHTPCQSIRQASLAPDSYPPPRNTFVFPETLPQLELPSQQVSPSPTAPEVLTQSPETHKSPRLLFKEELGITEQR